VVGFRASPRLGEESKEKVKRQSSLTIYIEERFYASMLMKVVSRDYFAFVDDDINA
jgi:hypothetical protein